MNMYEMVISSHLIPILFLTLSPLFSSTLTSAKKEQPEKEIWSWGIKINKQTLEKWWGRDKITLGEKRKEITLGLNWIYGCVFIYFLWSWNGQFEA